MHSRLIDMPQRIVIFDLDETLTRRDTYLPFLFGWLRKHPWRAYRLAQLIVPTLLFTSKKLGSTALKEIYLTSFMAGTPKEKATIWAEYFADQTIAHALRRQALARIERHRSAGDRIILASASIDLYVRPLAARLNISEVIASRCDYSPDNRLTGRLIGESLRGQAKLDAIMQYLGDVDPATVVAYSDHISDLPLLRWAGSGIAVNPRKSFLPQIAHHGLAIEDFD